MCLHDAKTKLAIESTLTTFNVVLRLGRVKREEERMREGDAKTYSAAKIGAGPERLGSNRGRRQR